MAPGRAGSTLCSNGHAGEVSAGRAARCSGAGVAATCNWPDAPVWCGAVMVAVGVAGPSGRTGSGTGARLSMPPVPLVDKGSAVRMSCAPAFPVDEAIPERTAPFGADGDGAISAKRTSGEMSLAGPAFAKVTAGASGVVREGGVTWLSIWVAADYSLEKLIAEINEVAAAARKERFS